MLYVHRLRSLFEFMMRTCFGQKLIDTQKIMDKEVYKYATRFIVLDYCTYLAVETRLMTDVSYNR